MNPFQDGFLGAAWDAPDGESGTMASQGAAMDLMGQWALGAFKNQAGVDDPPTTSRSNSAGSRSPRSRAAPAQPTDAFGGGDGFAVGKDAPPEAVDFLAVHHQRGEPADVGHSDTGLPANIAATDAVTDPEHAARARGAEQARRSCSCSSTSSSPPRSAPR